MDFQPIKFDSKDTIEISTNTTIHELIEVSSPVIDVQPAWRLFVQVS